MSSFPDFRAFYRAANRGREPLPWQVRLAEGVVTTGEWPREIAVPTGLGKTACIDIALYSLARSAYGTSQGPGTPRRIWYVVDRRLLVDVATEHALSLAALLAEPARAGDQESIANISAVAAALASLVAVGRADTPLHVTELRGGAALGSRPPEPSQPAIVLATVPMFASRLLFRGYGSSSAMWPIDAAHAGIDSLVLLDEAHLSRPLMILMDRCAACDSGDPSAVLPSHRARPALVALTATGRRDPDRFELDADDDAHPIVRQRLEAAKETALIETLGKDLNRALCAQALELLRQGDARDCVVFCNTPRRAREVERLLTKEAASLEELPEIMLLTGRTREREAAATRERLLDERNGVSATRDRTIPRPRPLVVVATQTLEVGADVDFDALVTESASVRALVQRFGRLNRLGTRAKSQAAICHPTDERDPIYGDEPSELWRRLAGRQSDELNLSPSRIADILGEPLDEPPLVPELLPAHLGEYAKTTRPEPGEAPPELFFSGFQDRTITASVCWRAYLPNDGVRLLPSVRAEESIELPVWELREALSARGFKEIRCLDATKSSLTTVATDRIAPGSVVVLPSSAGLYSASGWDPEATDPVLDVALLRARRLPLDAKAIASLLAPDADTQPIAQLLAKLEKIDDQAELDMESEIAEPLLKALHATRPHPSFTEGEWPQYLDSLDHKVERPNDDVPWLVATRSGTVQPPPPLRTDAFDELSFDTRSVMLSDHLGVVGELAARIACALGLNPSLIKTLRVAGETHDLGKADPRFQRWLDPACEAKTLLAKSRTPREEIQATRIAAGWPRGGPHETISARLLGQYLTTARLDGIDPELLIHLVLAHHGRARPVVWSVDDPAPTVVRAEHGGMRLVVSGDLATIDWEQPRRFHNLNHRYGLWGLALLEAILRQADHVASQMVEVG